jgi:hypothetical protein
MAQMMQVGFVEHFGKPLVTREVDVLTSGPGQMPVKTEPCGVCPTDLHAATGDWPLKPKLIDMMESADGAVARGNRAALEGATRYRSMWALGSELINPSSRTIRQ